MAARRDARNAALVPLGMLPPQAGPCAAVAAEGGAAEGELRVRVAALRGGGTEVCAFDVSARSDRGEGGDGCEDGDRADGGASGQRAHTAVKWAAAARPGDVATCVEWIAFPGRAFVAVGTRRGELRVYTLSDVAGTDVYANDSAGNTSEGAVRAPVPLASSPLALSLVLAQRLHAAPVVRLRCRSAASAASAASVAEELTVVFHDAVCRVDALELLNVLVSGVGAGAPGGHATGTNVEGCEPLPNVPRWDVGASAASVRDAACTGAAPSRSLFDAGADAAARQRGRYGVVAAGVSPFVAQFEGCEEERASAAAALAKKVAGKVAKNVTSVGSAMFSLASGLLARGGGASSVTLSEALRSTKDGGASGGDSGSADDDDLATARRMPCAPRSRLDDGGRQCVRLAQAPRGPLIALADSLGRVSLLDSRAMHLVRMWKGAYRDAHIAFVDGPPGGGGGSGVRELLLAVLAPLRRCVEVWPAGRHADGPLAEVACGDGAALVVMAPTLCAWSAAAAAAAAARAAGGSARGARGGGGEGAEGGIDACAVGALVVDREGELSALCVLGIA